MKSVDDAFASPPIPTRHQSFSSSPKRKNDERKVLPSRMKQSDALAVRETKSQEWGTRSTKHWYGPEVHNPAEMRNKALE